jgi:transcriptional regulator with XRE-family HTH domain
MNTKTTKAVELTTLRAMGEAIRAKRKALGLNATATAEAAGISRITLHRIEKGEPGVAMGAYFNAANALGLVLGVIPEHAAQDHDRSLEGWIPARIRLEDYPQLKQLAWHAQGVDALTPNEALGIYERNWRHLNEKNLLPHEKALINALRIAWGKPDANI